MSKPCPNRPSLFVTTAVFNDSHVTRFACWRAIFVSFERVVSLENYDVVNAIVGKVANFDKLYIGKFIPICITVLVCSHPNILALGKISITIVPQNGDSMSTICCNCNIIVIITIEITNSNIMWVTIGGICSCLRCTCCSC